MSAARELANFLTGVTPPDLPAQAIKYIRRVEELIRCPVALVSTSPERADTILVRDPFAD